MERDAKMIYALGARNLIKGPFSNFVIKIGRQRVKALCYIEVKTARSYL